LVFSCYYWFSDLPISSDVNVQFIYDTSPQTRW